MLLYFAQLTHTKNGVNQNRSFPLAAGFVSQYLLAKLGPNLNIEIYKTPETLNAALLRKKPDVLMFSDYLWNESLSCTFAAAAKAIYPDLLIVFGGPNLSLNKNRNLRFLRDNPAIDKLIFHEGEVPAVSVIEDFMTHRDVIQSRRFAVSNTMSIVEDEIFWNNSFTNLTKKIGDGRNRENALDEVPSPYLSGMFDPFFMDGEVPLIETNRGCPFCCSFCQQGHETFKKVRNFSIQRVREELEYISKKIHTSGVKIDSVYISDPNFAMFKRDAEICEIFREMQDKYNWPKNVIASTGKNQAELIIESTSKLKKGSILLRNAIQSLDEEALKAVDRSNIKLDAYEKIQNHIVELGMESNADIMLALPMETRQAHFDGIFKLIDTNTKEIACLQTIALKGTKFEEEAYMTQYQIKTKKRVIPACFASYNILNKTTRVTEFDEIIISNSTLSFEDYLQCRKLHFMVMTFHNTRLLEPVYSVLKDMGINRSEIIKNLLTDNEAEFTGLLDRFLEETKSELFDEFTELENRGKNLDEITSNKIFRNLSIAFYRKKDVIMSALHRTLIKVLGSENLTTVDDLINVLSLSIISPFEGMEDRSYTFISSKLQKLAGTSVTLHLSDRQSSILTTLNGLFKNPEDKINIMGYHLKPANMTRQVRYER